MLDSILFKLKKFIPTRLFSWVAPAYHYAMALVGALVYRFPSRRIIVVAVTGTKGKSSVTEILNAILEEAGFKTAVSNTIQFKIGDESDDNLYKMSMPGRMFMQRFIRRAVNAGCQYAVIEMTSQGAEMYRHRFIDIDALIVTNIAPEHIEAHGSYENYVKAKLEIARAVAHSGKKRTMIIVNKEDKESPRFLAYDPTEKYEYSIEEGRPMTLGKQGFSMTYGGVAMTSPLSGEFNVYNCLAAMTFARTQGIGVDVMGRAIEKF
ncbi:MAG: Mur ligase family protein, partial [Candidatus Paceibacterota bacterium]